MTRCCCWWVRVLCCVLVPFWLSQESRSADIPPRDYSVLASATVQESPAKITLNWPADPTATSYTISRREMAGGWQVLGNLPGAATTFSDANVSTGVKYEYQLVKTTPAYTGYGYLASGIRLPAADLQGTIILVVEESIASALSSELNRLRSDLVGDGWQVIRQDVSMNDSPAAVKSGIQSAYQSDPGSVRALFLFGHVPVPYAGDIVPDGHPNHQGAWPADVYYGDMDGVWTDSTVTSTNAERQVNWNLPGDGKFDQGMSPSPVELMIGRVDLHNMTCFANKANARSEVDLLRQYLNKNSAFRNGRLAVQRRGLICDNFSDKGDDPIAGSAWRAFPGFFGAANISEVPWEGYLPAATSGSYLWSYASGGGSYYYSMGVGTSDDFALQDVQVVFTMFMGSYFGDWNNESNFLRASLGSGTVLAASYSGFPHTFYFPMAMGETIGYAMRLSQNNGPDGLYPPFVQGIGEVHQSLHGDPTLRLFPVQPAANLTVNTDTGAARLAWSASSDTNIEGYYIYRGDSPLGPFHRITLEPVTGTTFEDTPAPGIYTYMVRAIKLEQSASGTYLNPSQGIFAQATVGDVVALPPNPPALRVAGTTGSSATIAWSEIPDATSYVLESKTGSAGSWAELWRVRAPANSYTHENLTAGTTYYYRIQAINDAGISPFSSEVSATITLAIPAAPTLQAAAQSHTQIDLQWNDVQNEDSYRLERRTSATAWSSLATLPANATSYSDQNLSPSTAYSYRIRASNAAGESAYSAEVSATTQPPPLQPPAAPVLTATAASHSQINLTWTAVENETGFKIERRPAGSSTWTVIATPDANAATYSDAGLTDSTSYTYRIRAFNSAGESAYSAEVSATTQAPPLQPPAAPVLTATAVSHTQINLTWTAVENEAGFKIERRPAGSSTWTVIATPDANATSYSDAGLTASTSYTYRIRAFNAAGESAYSAEVSATTQPPPLQPPVAPVLTATAASHTQINLAWTAVENETGFKIERRPAGSSTWTVIATPDANTTSYSDAGLTASTSYTYRIRAFNSAGESAYSAEVSATTQAPPLRPPAAPVLTATAASHTQINLTWTAVENEAGFKIERRLAGSSTWTVIATPDANATSYSDAGLTASTSYTYRIRAFNAAGESAYSAEVSATTQAPPLQPPAAPVLTATAASHTQINLTWTAVENEAGFKIERRPAGGSTWIVIATPDANATSYSDTGLTASTSYTYRIRAFNAAGESAFSAEVSATTAAAPTPASATFLSLDAQTSGLWPLEYGFEGNATPGQPWNLPNGVSLALHGTQEVNWEANTTDTRALVTPSGTSRSAAAWAAAPLKLELNAGASSPRRVALYLLDWERIGRAQHVTVRDAANGAILDERSIDQFGEGKYLVYAIQGEVEITIESSTDQDPVLSAVLFGEGMPAPISDRPLTLELLRMDADRVRLRMSGDSGQRFKIQTSADLKTWNDAAQSLILGGETILEITSPEKSNVQFFRSINTR